MNNNQSSKDDLFLATMNFANQLKLYKDELTIQDVQTILSIIQKALSITIAD